jgi:hypothetical protein
MEGMLRIGESFVGVKRQNFVATMRESSLLTLCNGLRNSWEKEGV